VLPMTVCGRKALLQARESSSTKTATHTMVSGDPISATGSENMKTRIKPSTKDFGRMTSNQVMAPRSGPKVRSTRENMKMAKSKDLESTHGPMVRSTQATGTIIRSMALDNTNGRMAVSISAIGKITTCMVMVFMFTLTV